MMNAHIPPKCVAVRCVRFCVGFAVCGRCVRGMIRLESFGDLPDLQQLHRANLSATPDTFLMLSDARSRAIN